MAWFFRLESHQKLWIAVRFSHFMHHSGQDIERLYQRNIFEEKRDIKLLMIWLFWAVLQHSMCTSKQ